MNRKYSSSTKKKTYLFPGQWIFVFCSINGCPCCEPFTMHRIRPWGTSSSYPYNLTTWGQLLYYTSERAQYSIGLTLLSLQIHGLSWSSSVVDIPSLSRSVCGSVCACDERWICDQYVIYYLEMHTDNYYFLSPLLLVGIFPCGDRGIRIIPP